MRTDIDIPFSLIYYGNISTARQWAAGSAIQKELGGSHYTVFEERDKVFPWNAVVIAEL